MEELGPAQSSEMRNVMLVGELKSGPLREGGEQHALRESGAEVRRGKYSIDARAGKLWSVSGGGSGRDSNAGEGGGEGSSVSRVEMRVTCSVGVMVLFEVCGKGRKNGAGLTREAGRVPTENITRSCLSVCWVVGFIGVHRGEHIGEGGKVCKDPRVMAGRIGAKGVVGTGLVNAVRKIGGGYGKRGGVGQGQ